MTLSQAAIITKNSILLLFLTIILGTAGGFGYKYYKAYQLSKLPPQEEKADNKFGLLPEVKFPKARVSSSNFSYSLDTTTGGFVKFPSLVKVYFIPQGSLTFLSPDKSKELARGLGFVDEPVQNDNQYQFTNGLGDSFIIDISTANFTLNRNEASASAKLKLQPLDSNQAIVQFKSFLDKNRLLVDELKNGKAKTIDYEVNLYPEGVDSLPVINLPPEQSLIRGKAKQLNDSILFTQIHYTFWPIDKLNYSTYKILQPEVAYEQLKQGRGYVAKEPTKPQVSLSNIYLAYYQTEEYSPYLQPVYVFEGPEFIGVVSAITK